MHDQATEIRRLVSETTPLEAIGSWKVVAVPTGIRVTLSNATHHERVVRSLTRQGYKFTRLRPVAGRALSRHTIVVTGWDGERMRLMLQSLRRQVSELTAMADQTPVRAIHLYEKFRMIDGLDREAAIAKALAELRCDEPARRAPIDLPSPANPN